MIFDAQRYSYIFADAIYSLPVGLLAGFFNRLLGLFLTKGKVRIFVKDLLTALVFTVLLYSYVISFANYKVLRWYNLLFALVGLCLFNPVFDTAVKTMGELCGVTAKYFAVKLYGKANRKIQRTMAKKSEKSQKNIVKNPPQLLQQTDKVVYN